MSSLLDTLMQQMGGDTMRQLSQQLGTDSATTSKAVGAALPALLSALARNAQTPDGAGALAKALDKDHDGSVLNNLPAMLGSGAGAGVGAGILKHVFGGKQEAVAQGVGATTGLGGAQSGQLLAMLAPIVMGALGNAKRSNGLDAGGLASMLGQERTAIASQGGGALGSIMKLIDQDGDGSVIDDIGGMLGKMMGR
jgi:hypothetical protein